VNRISPILSMTSGRILWLVPPDCLINLRLETRRLSANSARKSICVGVFFALLPYDAQEPSYGRVRSVVLDRQNLVVFTVAMWWGASYDLGILKQG